SVVFKNTGRTPALNVQTAIAWGQNTNYIPRIDPKVNPPITAGNFPADTSGHTDTAKIPASAMADISIGKPIYVFGTIWYNDIFSRQHWTQFCYEIIPTDINPRLIIPMPTTFHNSCDQNETNQ
ncbi:MAG TPA: hypothetical protein VKU37_05935, partial [Verrucomicrobiae bacterium]|nr:hypothetical protein [Verrucomicrobiae bacterium]